MKQSLLVAAALSLLSTAAWAGVGVWSGQGPYGGYIFDLLQSPSSATTLYMSTRSGIFKSTDGGANWAPTMHGIVGSVDYGYPLAIDADAANTLYAFDSTGHLYRSTDGAATWAQTGFLLPPIGLTTAVTKIIDAPGSTTRIYLTTVSGVLVSDDGGATFAALNGTGGNMLPSGVPFQWLSIDPSNPNNLLVGTQAYDLGVGPDVPCIYHSTDGGANWTPVLTVPEFGEEYYPGITDITFGHGSEVYALADLVLYSSPDGGATWSAVSVANANVNGYMTSLKPDASVAGGLYAGGYFGLMHSTDGGANLVSVANAANGLTPNGVDVATVSRFAFSGTTYWAATQDSGLFVSNNSGASWSSSNNGIDATNIRALAMVPVSGSPTRILAGYGDAFRPSPAMYAGTDSGDGNVTWSNSSTNLRAYQIRALAVDPTTATGAPGSTIVYAGGRSEQFPALAPRNAGVYRSGDGGTTWETIDTTVPQRFNGAPPFLGTARTFLLDPHSCPGFPGPCTGALQTAYVTSNGCFFTTGLGPSPGGSPSNVGKCGGANDARYVGSYQYRIMKSSNVNNPLASGGPTWVSSDTGLPQSYFGTAPNYFDSEMLYAIPLVIDPVDSNTLYVGTSDLYDPNYVAQPTLSTGIFKSTDGGAHWNQVNNGLPTHANSSTVLDILTLAIDPLDRNTLWASVIDIAAQAGSPGHIYKTTNGGASWFDSSAGLTSADIRALLVDHPSAASPAVLYAAGGGTSGDPGGVFKSYDAGASWHSQSIGLPADAALSLALDPADRSKLYAGTSSGVWEITQTTDSDLDGVSDIQEDLGPNGGDSNLDTIPDRLQADVTYVPPHASARPTPNLPPANNDFAVQVVAQSGPTCTQTQDVQAKSAGANGPDVIANNLNYGYDVDLLQFEILNCPGTTVKVTYPNFTFGKGWTFRFYGPATPGEDASIKWYDFSPHAVQLDAHSWQLTLARGQFGSYRPSSTGSILFQGGPAYSDRVFAGGFETAAN